MDKTGKIGHVADVRGKGDDGRSPTQQLRKLPRCLTAGVVAVEGEKDPGAAPEGSSDLLQALRSKRGTGGNAPLGQGQPVEDALREDDPREDGAEPSQPKDRLGAGWCLEPGNPLGVHGPAPKPVDDSTDDIGHHHRP